ncbi:hypothetical protein CEQ90_11565 [Lewinellaceae bacterium SD302]|nr:hypothetical protein CEQ90_11565 [Lewinellaceae bacterium SD302]
MRLLRLLPLLSLLPLLLYSSCGTKRQTDSNADDPIATISAAEKVMQQLEVNRFTAEWMDARASLDLDSPEMSVGGTAYIRMQKDKKIWMSVKKFGFEAARALITPDSFFVINRLTNEYTAEPLGYVEEKYKIPARFDLLQEIILGNPIFLDRNLELNNDEDTYRLSGNSGRWASDYYINAETFKLNSMRLKERAENRVLNVFMDDYELTENGQSFADKRAVEIESTETGLAKITLDFSKLTFNEEVSMPFVVPRKFDRGK